MFPGFNWQQGLLQDCHRVISLGNHAWVASSQFYVADKHVDEVTADLPILGEI